MDGLLPLMSLFVFYGQFMQVFPDNNEQFDIQFGGYNDYKESQDFADTENTKQFDILAHSGLETATKLWASRSQYSKRSQKKGLTLTLPHSVPSDKKGKHRHRHRRNRHVKIMDGEKRLSQKKIKDGIDGPPFPQREEYAGLKNMKASKKPKPEQSDIMLNDDGFELQSPEYQHVADDDDGYHHPNTEHMDSLVSEGLIPVGTDSQLFPSRVNLHTSPDIDRLLKDLQVKLSDSQEAQAKTRSVLYQIQERQKQQDESISFLKNEINDIKKIQVKDVQVIKALQTAVGDNNWAIGDVKTLQVHMKQDILQLKTVQKRQNRTMEALEKVFPQQSINDVVQSEINNLSQDVGDLKQQVSQNRKLIENLEKEIKLGDNDHVTKLRHSRRRSNKNRLPIIPDSEDTTEGSGRVIDKLLSKVEENVNVIEETRVTTPANSFNTTTDIPDTHTTESTVTKSELGRLYEMFFSLSIKISDVEKTLLEKQKEQFQKELRQMQQNFLNFTQHLLTMHVTQFGVVNSSIPSQKDIKHMNELVKNHGARLKSIEDIVMDHKLINRVKMNDITGNVYSLQQLLTDFRGTAHKHRHKASGMFQRLSATMEDYSVKIKKNDDRLAQLEVRVLNASFLSCEKNNRDIIQDLKIANLEKTLLDQKNKVRYNQLNIDRLDKTMHQLYNAAEQKGRVLDELIRQSQNVGTVMSQLTEVKVEVSKLLLQLPTDCEDVWNRGHNSSGVYLIKAQNAPKAVMIQCDMDESAPWTVIQRRVDGSTHFGRTWVYYKAGFGIRSRNYWAGNDHIHYLTNQANYTLKIDMIDTDNRIWTAEYSQFSISDESSKYTLHIDGYSGNATNSLKYSNNMAFSTQDSDNDMSSTHCAKFYTSGWWYKHCHYSNLNGRYGVGSVWFNNELDEWIQMKYTSMKISRTSSQYLH